VNVTTSSDTNDGLDDSTVFKAVSISIGGLVVVVAMIIAAVYFYKKNGNSQLPMGGSTANVENVSPSIADAETAEAIPITSANLAAMVSPTPQQDRTIKATAIVEPNDPGVTAKKNVVPTYKDQAQSVIHQDPPNTEVTSGLTDISDADAIPPQVYP
jgi:hypothetical protein